MKNAKNVSTGFNKRWFAKRTLYERADACSLQVDNFKTKPMQHGYFLMSDW